MLKQKLYKTWRERKPRKRKKRPSKISFRKLESLALVVAAIGAFIILLSLTSCAQAAPKSCALVDSVKVCRYLQYSNTIWCYQKSHPDDLSQQETYQVIEYFRNKQPILMSAEDYAKVENCRKDWTDWSVKHCK